MDANQSEWLHGELGIPKGDWVLVLRPHRSNPNYCYVVFEIVFGDDQLVMPHDHIGRTLLQSASLDPEAAANWKLGWRFSVEHILQHFLKVAPEKLWIIVGETPLDGFNDKTMHGGPGRVVRHGRTAVAS